MTTQRRCGLFLPGHNVHHIQALKLAPHAMAVPGSIVIEDGERLWLVPEDGSPRVGPFFQHSMPLIEAMVRDAGGKAELVPKLMLLRVPKVSSRAVFYLSIEPLEPCHPAGVIDEEWLT